MGRGTKPAKFRTPETPRSYESLSRSPTKKKKKGSKRQIITVLVTEWCSLEDVVVELEKGLFFLNFVVIIY